MESFKLIILFYALLSGTWNYGPELPFSWRYGQLVEDPLGGIVILRGETSKTSYSDALFRLSHSGDGAKWIELPQKLSIGKTYFIALLVSDDFANCTFNNSN